MPTATLTRRKKRLPPAKIGLESNGRVMSLEEFDQAEFVEGWRYELIHGVLVVAATPLISERDPNDELGHWLRTYKESHPQGSCLDSTVPEHEIRTLRSRRLADRVIWAGLGRLPRIYETPTIVAEFVSETKRDRERDYEEKREEYMKINVKEYWIIDRFERTMTVYLLRRNQIKKRVLGENQTYTTPLLPGFELDLGRLFAIADQWSE